MKGTISQLLAGLANKTDAGFLRTVLGAIGDRYASQALSSAGLVIKAGGSAVVKTGASTTYAMANGRLVSKAAATDMAALVGSVSNAKFNVFAFFIDQSGTLTSAMGIEASTLAGVKFPPIPVGKAMLGFVIINPTGTGNFVGGTTALDDATVVPNAGYVNTVGAFDPTVLV